MSLSSRFLSQKQQIFFVLDVRKYPDLGSYRVVISCDSAIKVSILELMGKRNSNLKVTGGAFLKVAKYETENYYFSIIEASQVIYFHYLL